MNFIGGEYQESLSIKNTELIVEYNDRLAVFY